MRTLLIGLHITKCAGTTLAMHVQNKLSPKAWYFCSAFRDTQMQSILELAERTNMDALQFVFGHYVHESLFGIVPGRNICLFTGVRSPVDRAVSEFFQISKIRERAGLAPIDTSEFFAMRKNTMCVEILRAFPSLAREAEGTLADKAITICHMFDLIYDTASFQASIAPLLKLVGVTEDGMSRANVRSSEMAERFSEQEKLIRHEAPRHFEQDQRLFDYLVPHLGKGRPFAEGDNGKFSQYRARWEPKLKKRGGALDAFRNHVAKHFVADYANLGLNSDLETLLTRKEAWLRALKSAQLDRSLKTKS